ncbi:hypothetical protein AC629_04280 [Bradyrhizobium sp. NAS80.1]|uniref:oligosaccharide flippase family protein n=1 Tax=Bradyrhizobium sp. NAS80.1 TaxID=1680159 RepID=UPI00095D5729|nr:oligosaccharide flippase family protein [Bradyrhizobium sp. NAS80.1]OKO90682.1 hypothetical protein AC629_04280 [Bradyrhizobium sp. NAS80.1]
MIFRLKLASLTARLSLAAVAPLVGFSSRFLRTVLLSHFLAPGELGVAIAITVVISTSELISEVGLNHLVLVRSGSEAREFLAAAHLLQLARGMMISTVLAALCVPISSLFGISQLWKSFLVAAVIPLVRSFYHLGVYQIQREYQYRPYALSVGISTLAGLGVAMLLVFWIPDHRTILISLVCETLLFVILSHLLTPIRYECHATASVLREVLKYGLPLTANGIALALISQVDRILVAGALGVETLAVYAVVIGLAQTPISPLFEIFGTLGMSMMVRSQARPDQQLASFAWLMWLFSLLAFTYAASVGLTLDLLAPPHLRSALHSPAVMARFHYGHGIPRNLPRCSHRTFALPGPYGDTCDRECDSGAWRASGRLGSQGISYARSHLGRKAVRRCHFDGCLSLGSIYQP